MKLNLRKIQRMAVVSIKQGINLHFDSMMLFKNKSYGTAIFVSVIAMEELGKGFAADRFAQMSKTNPRVPPKQEEKFLYSMPYMSD
jgi:AbiV family abortive infection protein